MKLLMIAQAVPHPFHPSVARSYFFMKYYAQEISITLLAPLVVVHKVALPNSVNFEACPVPSFKSLYSKALYSIGSRLTLMNIRYARDFGAAHKLYYPALQRRIVEILRKDHFDVIYSGGSFYSYLLHYKLSGKIEAPIILEFSYPTLYGQRNFLKFGKISDKLRFLLGYLSYRLFEVEHYKHFDGGIYVSKTHLELSRPFTPKKCFVIPPGVDIEYFKPSNTALEDRVVLFIGTMSYLPNVSAVLWFYYKVYPYVKQNVPNVKFYVIGRNPDTRIKRLRSDSSVIVTGSVKDVRPYFSKASVFINPIIIDDGGIKTKVLEAMAMGKAVVSTPLGVRDLGVTNEHNIVVTKNDKEFAEKVVSLLKDENYRKQIGLEARRFVEMNYSWEKQSRILYTCLKELIEGRG